MDGWIRDDELGGFKFIDEYELDRMKKEIPQLIKHLVSEIIQGKHIFNISLPVYIFAKDSFLTLVANSSNGYPVYH